MPKGKKKQDHQSSSCRALWIPITKLTPWQIQDIEFSAVMMKETIEEVVLRLGDTEEAKMLVGISCLQAGETIGRRLRKWQD